MNAALDQAIKSEDIALVSKLIGQKVDLDARFEDGTTPLVRAVATGNLELVQVLLKANLDIDATCEPNKDTALHEAAVRGLPEILDELIRAGADVNRLDTFGNTALGATVLSEEEKSGEVIEKLIAAKTNLEAGRVVTALMRAASSGALDSMKLLLDAGANPNTFDEANGTALLQAIEDNEADAVRLLLERGADPSIRTPGDTEDEKLTPLQLAKELKHKKIVQLLEKATGAAPASRSKKPSTDGWNEIRKFLKKHKPDVFASLRKAAQQASIEKLAQAIGESLPELFMQVYAVNDGQEQDDEPLAPPSDDSEEGYYLLPIRQILADWKMQTKLSDAGEFQGRKVTPSKEVAKSWWHRKWVPFAGDGQGDYLCLDFAPAAGGKKGQVISFSHEWGQRKLLAASFSEWLADLAEQLKETEEDE